jgi:hypothetical protein
MRANVPTDDFVTNLPEEARPSDSVTKDQLELAAIGNDPKWAILTNYMAKRIEVYQQGLFGEDLSKQDTTIIGQRFLAAQSVIREFQSLLDEINTTTKAVNDILQAEA